MKKRNNYNVTAVEKTAEVFGFSERYVRACLKGDRKGVMADRVIRKYKQIVFEIKKAVENAVNK